MRKLSLKVDVTHHFSRSMLQTKTAFDYPESINCSLGVWSKRDPERSTGSRDWGPDPYLSRLLGQRMHKDNPSFRYGMSFSMDSFCPRCAEINFDLFTRPPQRDRNDELLGISWSALLPERCQFCQLLLHCICESQGIRQPLQGILRGVYASHELQLYADYEETSRILNYSIRRCEPMPSSYPFAELQNSAHFNVKELKHWLNQCESHQCLPSDHSHSPLLEDFRLVDVQNNCVVQPKTHVKYCALSYVWGDVLQPSLDSNNPLESQNSLEPLDLPKTILDAMDLCRDIGCQYLWVDSLCIVQDSDDDKHRQILSMAEVYSRSFLAIVAAAGDDANAGLPPYGQPGRNPSISCLVRRTSKGSFVASLSPQIAAQEIARSSWASRGWTLQEYALSRRVLFFTGSYTFLRCEKGLWCEDFDLGFSNCFEEDLKWDLPLPPFYRRTEDPDRHYPSTFSQLLAHFVHRRLRYGEDILAAFTGILTRMEDSIGSHIWGLPSKEFGAALQWTTNLPFPSTKRDNFPGWSWAGWILANNFGSPNGSFHDIYKGFDEIVTNMSVLTCYKVTDDKSIHTVEKCDLERILVQFRKANQRYQYSYSPTVIDRLKEELQQYFTPQPCQELQTYIELQSPSKPPLSHHIFLWASCTSLYVSRPSTVENGMVNCDLIIEVKEQARRIGSIRLSSRWREKEPDDRMDFFVSTVGVHSTAGPVSRPVELKFKVILVKLYRNTNPPVYERVQVSHEAICHTDWTLAKPKSRLIALV